MRRNRGGLRSAASRRHNTVNGRRIEAGAGPYSDAIAVMNNYIIDIGTNIAHYREVRDKYVNTAAPPASTIGVPQLARPGALFEVEAIAVLPPK
jgi:2-iminobutanoate/2-iminopropanoate deaminase